MKRTILFICLAAAYAVDNLEDDVSFPDDPQMLHEQQRPDREQVMQDAPTHLQYFAKAMSSNAKGRAYDDELNDARRRPAFNDTIVKQIKGNATAQYNNATMYHNLALKYAKEYHPAIPAPTHPDGDSAVLYTNNDDARFNKEGLYLPPKKVQNYSPLRTRECCKNSCEHRYTSDQKNASECTIGCNMWLGASSLNWESKTWHTKLRNKCQTTCQMSKNHALTQKSTDYYKRLGLTADDVPACKQGCEEYLTCIYGLETTPLTWKLASDFNSHISLEDLGNNLHHSSVHDGERLCTAIGKDKQFPNLGACCHGLHGVREPRKNNQHQSPVALICRAKTDTVQDVFPNVLKCNTTKCLCKNGWEGYDCNTLV